MTRVLSGVVLGASFFAIVWFGNTTVLLAVAAAVCALAFHEYVRLMRHIGADLPYGAALLPALASVIVVPFPYVPVEVVIGTGVIVVAAAAMMSSRELVPAMHGAAAGALAIVYLGLPLGALVAVHLFGGRGAVILLVATIAVSDTAQYYSGRTFGRRALAPRLSPKKTVEGAIGGFVVAPVFLYFAGPYLVPVAHGPTVAALGVLLVAAGIAGDLFESMLKRAANLKDSSSLIPGHGGILDRIDALLFATPIFYSYIRWVYA
jgi:phosphatidate cytidylyltransferase